MFLSFCLPVCRGTGDDFVVGLLDSGICQVAGHDVESRRGMGRCERRCCREDRDDGVVLESTVGKHEPVETERNGEKEMRKTATTSRDETEGRWEKKREGVEEKEG